MTPSDKLPGIHALRVVAAVTVFLLHTLNLTARFVEPVTNWAGAHLHFGVPLFFVVSAFSLMYSTILDQGSSGWVRRFYLKRYFRIAPLFYFMLVAGVALQSLMGGLFALRPLPDLYSLFLNVTFLFGLFPEHSSSLVWVGWSVGTEMLFYLLFPLILVTIRNIYSAAFFVIIATVIGETARPLLDPLASLAFGVTVSDQHILPNLRYFAFGILAFHIYDRLRTTKLAAKNAGHVFVGVVHLLFISLAMSLIVFLIYFQDELRALWHLDMAVWGALFTVLCVWLTVRPLRLLNWAPIQYLGERSYSLYLVHFPAILLLSAFTKAAFGAIHPFMGDWAIIVAIIATYAPIIAISAITYRLIERSGMDLGKLLTRQIGRGSKIQATHTGGRAPD
ncbi:MAG: acyltransferase [Hyphomonadaceae bacterium]|nr:acyltransferase [Hyphomonadaceae bacterium]